MKKSVTTSLLMIGLFFGHTSCSNEETTKEISVTTDVKEKTANSTARVGNCAAVPGWAAANGGTTGGGTAAETVVSNYSQLKAAIENTAIKVIRVTGTITIPATSTGRITFQDQTGKTIYGASGARLVSTDQTKANSGILNIKRCKNIIIRNLIFIKIKATDESKSAYYYINR